MRATAQSENTACALGINLAATRTLAFVIAAALAGLAGALYTFLNLFVNFETFTFFHSISFLLMVILGGTGTLLGPIVGTAMLTYLAELLQGLQEWQTLRLRYVTRRRHVPDAARRRRDRSPSVDARGAQSARPTSEALARLLGRPGRHWRWGPRQYRRRPGDGRTYHAVRRTDGGRQCAPHGAVRQPCMP